MKIALFSDIHANLPALQAFFEDVDKHQPDAIYCLGDLVGYNVWPNEVIAEIRRRHIPTIAGNYDFGIGRHSDDCGCAYKTDQDKADGKISISFTNEIISDDSRAYLRHLPEHISVEYKINEEPARLLLVHGSPRKINEYLFEDRDEKSFLRILNDANAHILCFGHTHKPFHRKFKTGTRELHAVNIGSIGKPKDNDPRGCYAILTVEEEHVHVDFIRFQYNVEEAARAIETSILPDTYALMLRKGI
jgi:putative phosphoesterase